MSDKEHGYLYDPSWADERRRLEALERLNDPATIQHLELVGVAPGWRCLEVGGGGGSIVRWLCSRVGSTGSVVATDLDTRFLEEIETDNLEIRRHNIVEEELEHDSFDLVHSRFLLEHLPQYREALARMVAALKPGGWLVAEDVDFAVALMGNPAERPGVPAESIETGAELMTLLVGMTAARGIQPDLGRRLPALFVEAGLEDVGAEGFTTWLWSGSEEAEVGRLSLEHVTKVAVEAGLMSEDDRARYLSLTTDPSVGTFSPLRFGAWGRKPAAG